MQRRMNHLGLPQGVRVIHRVALLAGKANALAYAPQISSMELGGSVLSLSATRAFYNMAQLRDMSKGAAGLSSGSPWRILLLSSDDEVSRKGMCDAVSSQRFVVFQIKKEWFLRGHSLPHATVTCGAKRCDLRVSLMTQGIGVKTL
jgi:hypothetical protein